MKLGEMLVQSGTITQDQLDHALKIQKHEGGLLGIILIRLGHITEEDLTKHLKLIVIE